MNPSQNLGKSTEMLVSSMLLAENRELYLPAVDDHGVDMIVRTMNYDKTLPVTDPRHYEFQEIQVKSVTKGGLFAAMKCDPRPNYWFVFYIRNIDRMWMVNSEDLIKNASITRTGASIGKLSFDLKPSSRTPLKHPEYLITDFSKLP